MNDVEYADGSEDFALYITSDGEFHCEPPTDLCPPGDDELLSSVAEVASANAEGIVLRLSSGALYYRRKDGKWTADEDAVAAGTLGGALYRLRRDGAIECDGTTLRHAQSMVVTNDAVVVDGVGVVWKLGTMRATPTDTAQI